MARMPLSSASISAAMITALIGLAFGCHSSDPSGASQKSGMLSSTRSTASQPAENALTLEWNPDASFAATLPSTSIPVHVCVVRRLVPLFDSPSVVTTRQIVFKVTSGRVPEHEAVETIYLNTEVPGVAGMCFVPKGSYIMLFSNHGGLVNVTNAAGKPVYPYWSGPNTTAPSGKNDLFDHS
jgi:hypothetical protein